jgi:amino acid transporter
MSDRPFQISQGFEVLLPKSGKAYPVPCEEWDFLKKKIDNIAFSNNLYNDGGWVLLGIALTTLGSILLNVYASINLIIAWAIVGVTLITGILCLFFNSQIIKIKKINASDIIKQMEIIEKRYRDDIN